MNISRIGFTGAGTSIKSRSSESGNSFCGNYEEKNSNAKKIIKVGIGGALLGAAGFFGFPLLNKFIKSVNESLSKGVNAATDVVSKSTQKLYNDSTYARHREIRELKKLEIGIADWESRTTPSYHAAKQRELNEDHAISALS